jgi:hypothetical protein
MKKRLELLVRRNLLAYVDGKITAKELWHWLMDHVIAPDAMRKDEAVRALAGPAVLYFAEFQLGHRTDGELRELLQTIAITYGGTYSLVGEQTISLARTENSNAFVLSRPADASFAWPITFPTQFVAQQRVVARG